MVASGCLRSPREIATLADPRKLGAIVTATVTQPPVAGAPTPRIAETPAGILHDNGWQNPGIEAFIAEDLPPLVGVGVPVIVSVGGFAVNDFALIAMRLREVADIAGIEVNLSCPDIEKGGEHFANRPEHAAEAIGAVTRVSRVPVFAKLSATAADIVDVAGSCVHAGAAAVTMINSLPGMEIDTRLARPRIGSGLGWVSGPALRPVASRMVHEVARAMPDVTVVGVGGISTGADAVERMLAGASAVQVGTAALIDPWAPIEVTTGVLRYMKERRLSAPEEIRGVMGAR
jgi:dihydroorotate dehydrogenase (NAD+) catalytic subunit